MNKSCDIEKGCVVTEIYISSNEFHSYGSNFIDY